MRRVAVVIVEVVVYYLVYKLLTWQGPPLDQVFWFKMSRTCQWVALCFGRAGLHAEARYHSSTGNPPTTSDVSNG